MKVYYGCKCCGFKFDEDNAEFDICHWQENTKIVICPNCKRNDLYVLIVGEKDDN